MLGPPNETGIVSRPGFTDEYVFNTCNTASPLKGKRTVSREYARSATWEFGAELGAELSAKLTAILNASLNATLSTKYGNTVGTTTTDTQEIEWDVPPGIRQYYVYGWQATVHQGNLMVETTPVKYELQRELQFTGVEKRDEACAPPLKVLQSAPPPVGGVAPPVATVAPVAPVTTSSPPAVGSPAVSSPTGASPSSSPAVASPSPASVAAKPEVKPAEAAKPAAAAKPAESKPAAAVKPAEVKPAPPTSVAVPVPVPAPTRIVSAAPKPTATATTAAPTPAPVAISQFTGTWQNVDPATRGITRIEMSAQGPAIVVRAFERCEPVDCDLGAVQLPFVGNPVTVPFETSFKTTMLTLTVQNNTLMVRALDIYASGSARANRDISYSLRRQ